MNTRLLLWLSPLLTPLLYPLVMLIIELSGSWSYYGLEGIPWAVWSCMDDLFRGFPTGDGFLLTISVMSLIFLVTLIVVIPVIFVLRSKAHRSG